MKNLKLFLLGSIITLLSILSFSNAGLFGFSESYYNGWGTTGDPTYGRVETIDFKSFYCKGEGTVKVTVDWRNGSAQYIQSCPGFYDGTYNGASINYITALKRSSTSVLIYNNSSNTPDIVFTPAINGLKGTVFEIIPYVVFIGIGMLLATIGFYAIRRLVNWLSGKINSNFKSKR